MRWPTHGHRRRRGRRVVDVEARAGRSQPGSSVDVCSCCFVSRGTPPTDGVDITGRGSGDDHLLAGFQPSPGLYSDKAAATSAVCSPKSFWYTVPSSPTMKLMIPEFLYSM